MLTRSLRADLGVMISASHNPYHDNGIKLFGPDGSKLSDDAERTIEALMQNGLDAHLAPPDKLGRAKRLDDAQARYIEFAKNTFPRNLRLDGLKLVVDCAHGAAYKVAPEALWELGAEVIPIGVDPNGYNINKDGGSTAPARMRAAVIEHGADLGIALDGDADRVVFADETGRLVDGDRILAVIARSWKESGKLSGGGVVTTVMSNFGLEMFLKDLGLATHRTQVGDRYVVEQMRDKGCNLGGEQSGHIIMSDFNTTGDGLIAALQVLAVVQSTGKRMSALCDLFDPYPQLLKNVRYANGAPLEDGAVKEAIRAAEAQLNGRGRLVIRKSGTEPVIRVMAEADDEALVRDVVAGVVSALEKVAA
jgi:phosphoglucosamine mutase